jgi:hypothetical protein
MFQYVQSLLPSWQSEKEKYPVLLTQNSLSAYRQYFRIARNSARLLSQSEGPVGGDIWNPIYKVCASPYFRRTNAFVPVAEFTNTLRGFSGGLVKPTRPLEHMICLASAECEKEYIAVCRIIEESEVTRPDRCRLLLADWASASC